MYISRNIFFLEKHQDFLFQESFDEDDELDCSGASSADEVDDGLIWDQDWCEVAQLRLHKDVQVVGKVRAIARTFKKSELKRNSLRERTAAEFGICVFDIEICFDCFVKTN